MNGKWDRHLSASTICGVCGIYMQKLIVPIFHRNFKTAEITGYSREEAFDKPLVKVSFCTCSLVFTLHLE